jgi:hypothetical protein
MNCKYRLIRVGSKFQSIIFPIKNERDKWHNQILCKDIIIITIQSTKDKRDLDFLHSYTFTYISTKILWERMKRDNMIGDNDNIVLKNKLNIGEYRIFLI